MYRAVWVAVVLVGCASPDPLLRSLAERPDFAYELRLEGAGHAARFDPETPGWKGRKDFAALVRRLFTPEAGGPLALRIELPGQARAFTFYSKSPAEAVYALRLLLRPDDAGEWLDALGCKSRGITFLSVGEGFDTWDRIKARRLQPPDAALDPSPVSIARALYDASRAGLMTRFRDSFLFHPPAEELQWVESRDGDRIWVESSFADSFYFAVFRFAFDQDTAGSWKPAVIQCGEFFRGRRSL